MTTLKVAFWNVENLFEAGTHPPGPGGDPPGRGPQTGNELDSKITRVAECIDDFFDGSGPDLLGLAEVHTDRILGRIESALINPYVWVWEPAGRRTETGLAVLARQTLVRSLSIRAVQRPSNMSYARPRCMIAQCEFNPIRQPILFAVNHWKSRLVRGTATPRAAAIDREETADWLGDWLSRSYRPDCAIVVGDFNTEPTDPAFGAFRLRSARRFSTALWTRATPAYLYNTSWKFLTEPLAWEDCVQAGGGKQDPRPKRTHDRGYVVWDQLMVSGKALRDGPIRLAEKTVAYYHNEGVNAEYNQNGAMCPIRWEYHDQGNCRGASDHYPVLAEFEIR